MNIASFWIRLRHPLSFRRLRKKMDKLTIGELTQLLEEITKILEGDETK